MQTVIIRELQYNAKHPQVRRNGCSVALLPAPPPLRQHVVDGVRGEASAAADLPQRSRPELRVLTGMLQLRNLCNNIVVQVYHSKLRTVGQG